MTKEKLIKQILNETNIDLYNFFAKKLLTEYPEYKQKVLDYWIHLSIDSRNIIISQKVIIKNKNITSNDGFFHYTSKGDLEKEGFLNWVLRKERYD